MRVQFRIKLPVVAEKNTHGFIRIDGPNLEVCSKRML